jgi:hypothetical protein
LGCVRDAFVCALVGIGLRGVSVEELVALNDISHLNERYEYPSRDFGTCRI